MLKPLKAHRRFSFLLGILVIIAVSAPGPGFAASQSLLASLTSTTDQPAKSNSASNKPANKVPYATLADMLANNQARKQLITELRRLAKQQSAAHTATGQSAKTHEKAQAVVPRAGAKPAKVIKAPSGQTKKQVSLPRRVANATHKFAESLTDRFAAGWATIEALSKPSARPTINLAVLQRAALGLVFVMVTTAALFLVLRRLAKALFVRADRWAQRGKKTWLRPFLAIAGSMCTDIIVILLAGVGGYALALFAFGERGMVDTRQSLFLNAFVLIELFKVLIRMVFAPRFDNLRLFAMRREVAAYWNTRLTRLTNFIGYGTLVAVPIVNFDVAPALGRLLSLLVMGITYVYAIVIILKNRAVLRERLINKSKHVAFMRLPIRVLARTWHLWAISYFTALFILSQLRPKHALPFMLLATLQTLLAIGIGMLLSALLTRLIGRRIELSPQLRARLPSLEKRLNSYIPDALKTIRLIILVAVILVVCDAWSLFDLGAWAESSAGAKIIVIAIHVAIILVVAALLWTGVVSLIENHLSPDTGKGEPSAREKTLLALFQSALAITFIILTLMIVLSQIGINIAPLIASAGVLGVAIGFGAQSLVADIITGVFIQLENAIDIGDVVSAAGITGTAEQITIRSLRIRDLSGTYHLIPFSSVKTVSNYMRDFAYHVGEYRISYREDVDEAAVHLQAAFDELQADNTQHSNLLGPLSIPGVTALADSSVNIRVMIKTKPGSQWAVGRAYNRLVKKHFDAAGIEIPVPHTTLYFGQDKAGSAPPAHVELARSTSMVENTTTEKAQAGETERADNAQSEHKSNALSGT